MPPSLLRIVPVAALVTALGASMAACGSDAPPMGAAVRGRDSMAVMTTRGMSKLISDSGVIRYKIIAEEWRVYDKTLPPRWEFPKGIFLERYDDKFKIDLHITADSAWFYDQKVWRLKGHVVLDDRTAQTHLTTEELTWNVSTGAMASDTYTRLIQPNQAIEGNWFRATVLNQDITRYYVRQTKGFMPMGDLGSPAGGGSATADTARKDTLPMRERPMARPRRD